MKKKASVRGSTGERKGMAHPAQTGRQYGVTLSVFIVGSSCWRRMADASDGCWQWCLSGTCDDAAASAE